MQYALITKHRTPSIVILANSIKELDKAINTFYYNKKDLKPKGSKFEIEEMLKEYKKVKITIENL